MEIPESECKLLAEQSRSDSSCSGVELWICLTALCDSASGSAVVGLAGSCSKKSNTSIAGGEFGVAIEPVDCLRAIGSGAACSLLCLSLALALPARRERETDSWVIVEPLPLEPAENVVMPENSDTREDKAFFLVLDRRPLRSLFAPREVVNMLGLL